MLYFTYYRYFYTLYKVEITFSFTLSKMKTLGKKLKAIRLSKGLSQEDMAYDLEISLSTYSKIERDVTDITISRLEGIAKIFKMGLIEILTYGSDNPSHSQDCKKLLEEKDKEIISLQKELISAMKKNKRK